jgi:hypothetical protein
MAKLTVIQIVQRVLSAIDSDNVTSISDTVESEQVKDILDTVYDRLLDDFPWDHLKEYGTLEVTAIDNEMKLPANILHLNSIRYNKKDVQYLSPEDMVKKLDGRDVSLSNVDSLGAINDQDPTYWTSYDSETIVFDSYDGTLTSSLSNCSFVKKPAILTSDSDIPNMPDRLHTVLLDGVFEETFRLLKGDIQGAAIYQRKYLVGLGKAKRWANRINLKDSTYGDDYGRTYY